MNVIQQDTAEHKLSEYIHGNKLLRPNPKKTKICVFFSCSFGNTWKSSGSSAREKCSCFPTVKLKWIFLLDTTDDAFYFLFPSSCLVFMQLFFFCPKSLNSLHVLCWVWSDCKVFLELPSSCKVSEQIAIWIGLMQNGRLRHVFQNWHGHHRIYGTWLRLSLPVIVPEKTWQTFICLAWMHKHNLYRFAYMTLQSKWRPQKNFGVLDNNEVQVLDAGFIFWLCSIFFWNARTMRTLNQTWLLHLCRFTEKPKNTAGFDWWIAPAFAKIGPWTSRWFEQFLPSHLLHDCWHLVPNSHVPSNLQELHKLQIRQPPCRWSPCNISENVVGKANGWKMAPNTPHWPVERWGDFCRT